MYKIIAKLMKSGFSLEKALRIARKSTPSSLLKSKMRKTTLKDLTSDKSWNRYKNNLLDDLNAEIKYRKQNIKNLASDLGGGSDRRRSMQMLIWQQKNRIEQFQKRKRALLSKSAKQKYIDVVEAQVNNTPITFKSKVHSNAAGSYTSTSPSSINKDLKGVGFNDPTDFAVTQPTDALATRIHAMKRKGKNIDFSRSKRADIHGDIDIKIKGNPFKMISTGVHELKHSAQNALPGYRKAASHRIRKDFFSKSKYSNNGGPGQQQYTDYIAMPEEISARLTQYRVLSKSARNKLDKLPNYKLFGNNNVPQFYKDLRDVMGSGKKVKKASQEVWAAAPIGGILGLATEDKV